MPNLNQDYYKTEDIAALNAYAKDIEEKVNRLLNAGGRDNYLKCCEIIKDPNNECCFQVSKPLMNLRILAIAEEAQLNKEDEVTVFDGRDLYTLEELYQEIVFKLRRLEFNIETDVRRDILQFLVDEKIGADVLLVVIRLTTYLYSKDKIWEAITKGLKNE